MLAAERSWEGGKGQLTKPKGKETEKGKLEVEGGGAPFCVPPRALLTEQSARRELG